VTVVNFKVFAIALMKYLFFWDMILQIILEELKPQNDSFPASRLWSKNMTLQVVSEMYVYWFSHTN